MFNTNSPESHVDELKERLREEAGISQEVSLTPLTSDGLADLEEHIHSIEKSLRVRSQLPKQLNRFPFNRIKILERSILKVLELLFHDQRKVNESLLEVLKLTKKCVHQAKEETMQATQRLVLQAKEESGKAAQWLVLQTQAESVKEAQRLALQAQAEAVKQTTALRQEVKYVKINLSQQNRLFDIMLNDENSPSLKPFNEQQQKEILEEKSHLFDSLYVAFEDKFRGGREEIKRRFKVHLPIIAEVNSCIPDLSILDIGSGRGEWLELLQESGYSARGVDRNKVMIEQCQERKLTVIEADAISYLRSLPDASLGIVTAFHIIEHLPFEILIMLLDEMLRVLKPGGLVILETPNPENVLVGSCSFYLDPTHRNPLPSPMVKFMAEERGYSRVEIMNLHPIEKKENLESSGLPEFLLERFFGPQDYAMIGYKQ